MSEQSSLAFVFPGQGAQSGTPSYKLVSASDESLAHGYKKPGPHGPSDYRPVMGP